MSALGRELKPSFWNRHPMLTVVVPCVAVLAVAAVGLRTSESNRAQHAQAERESMERWNSIVWGPAPCPVVGLDGGGYLRIRCGEQTHYAEDKAIVMSYVLNPGPLTCKVNGYGKSFCEQRPFKIVTDQ